MHSLNYISALRSEYTANIVVSEFELEEEALGTGVRLILFPHCWTTTLLAGSFDHNDNQT